MPDVEDIITELENRFPTLSGVAFDTARRHTLKAGISILASVNGGLYEIFPDGSRKRVKDIEPPTAAVSGRKIAIR